MNLMKTQDATSPGVGRISILKPFDLSYLYGRGDMEWKEERFAGSGVMREYARFHMYD